MNNYGYDSFGGGGPSLSLRPEELDKLDASHLELTDPPSISIDSIHYRNLEASINGTINALKDPRPIFTRNNFASPPPQHGRNINRSPPTLLTPPSSSQPVKAFSTFAPVANNMPKFYDQRMDVAQQNNETEMLRRTAEGYRQQLSKVQMDMELLVAQHQQVIKTKDEMEHGYQMEVSVFRRDLKREKDLREAEKDKYQKQIKELHMKVKDLERRLGERGQRRRNVHFADDYGERMEEMQRENDAKIANLVRHFEKEKESALEILKSKIRAEVSLLIPKIKDQCHRLYSDRVQTIKESLGEQLRDKYEGMIRRMREDHSLERRMWQRQTKEIIEQERLEIAQKIKAKYELKMMDIRNECERRILSRLRGNGSNQFNYSSSNESSLSYESDDDSFL